MDIGDIGTSISVRLFQIMANPFTVSSGMSSSQFTSEPTATSRCTLHLYGFYLSIPSSVRTLHLLHHEVERCVAYAYVISIDKL